MQLKFNLTNYIDEAVRLIPSILNYVTREDQYQSKDLELTIPQLRFLRVVYEKNEITMKQVSQALAVAPPSATITAEQLVKQGLISRQDDREDRRVIRINLTSKGKSLMKKFMEAKRARWREIMDSLSEQDRKALLETLRQVLTLLQKAEEKRERT